MTPRLTTNYAKNYGNRNKSYCRKCSHMFFAGDTVYSSNVLNMLAGREEVCR